jgi:hypothetical protein
MAGSNKQSASKRMAHDSAQPEHTAASPVPQEEQAVDPTGLPLHRSDADRIEMVAREAYLLAERRGFQPGHELRDWFEAERKVDALIGLQPPG